MPGCGPQARADSLRQTAPGRAARQPKFGTMQTAASAACRAASRGGKETLPAQTQPTARSVRLDGPNLVSFARGWLPRWRWLLVPGSRSWLIAAERGGWCRCRGWDEGGLPDRGHARRSRVERRHGALRYGGTGRRDRAQRSAGFGVHRPRAPALVLTRLRKGSANSEWGLLAGLQIRSRPAGRPA